MNFTYCERRSRRGRQGSRRVSRISFLNQGTSRMLRPWGREHHDFVGMARICGTSRRATRNLRAREFRWYLPRSGPRTRGTPSATTAQISRHYSAQRAVVRASIKQHKQRALARDERGRPSRAGHRVKMSCVNVPGGPLGAAAPPGGHPAARFIRSLRELVCFRVITPRR